MKHLNIFIGQLECILQLCLSKKTQNTCTEDQSAHFPPCRGAFFHKSAGSLHSETRVDAHDRAPRRTYLRNTVYALRPTLQLACTDIAVVRIASFLHQHLFHTGALRTPATERRSRSPRKTLSARIRTIPGQEQTNPSSELTCAAFTKLIINMNSY